MQLYKISFPVHLSKKCYIGITSKTDQERFKSHCRFSKKNYAISNALKKYGKENAIIIVLAECDNWELLCLAEQEAIEKFNTFCHNGYNLTKGGDGILGLKHNKETKEKLRQLANKQFSTKESRERVGLKSNEVYRNNCELRLKISESLKRFYEENPERIEIQKEKVKTYNEKNPEKLKLRALKIKEYSNKKDNKKAISERNKKRHIDRPNDKIVHGIMLKEKYNNVVYKTKVRLAQAVGFCKKAGRPFSELPKDYFNAKV